MKAFLRAPIRFLLLSLLFALICAGVSLLYRLADYEPVQAFTVAHLWPILHDVLGLSFPLIALAMVMALFTNLKLPKFRFWARLLVWILGAGALFGCFLAWPLTAKPITELPPHRLTVLSNTVYQVGQVSLSLGSVQGTKASDVVFRAKLPNQTIVQSPVASLDPVATTLTIPDLKSQINLSELYGTADALYAMGPGATDDARFVDAAKNFMVLLMNRASQSWLDAAIFAGAIALAVISVWFWARSSRWPLWNGLAVGFWLIGLGWSFYWLLDPSVVNALTMFHPLVGLYAVPLACGLFAIIWSVCLLLLPPFKDWKREVNT